MSEFAEKALLKLIEYCEKEGFKGYDPYDTLNSWVPFHWLGKWGSILAIQFQKRNPINIRPLIGIIKFHSTKGMGLLLSGYLKLYTISHDKGLLNKIEYIKNWLLSNSTLYKGTNCWGYDYPYVTPDEKVKKAFPTVVHHSYITKALFEYYQIIKNETIKEKILKSYDFILNNIPVT